VHRNPPDQIIHRAVDEQHEPRGSPCRQRWQHGRVRRGHAYKPYPPRLDASGRRFLEPVVHSRERPMGLVGRQPRRLLHTDIRECRMLAGDCSSSFLKSTRHPRPGSVS